MCNSSAQQEWAIGMRTQSSCWDRSNSTHWECTSVFIETASSVCLAALWLYFCLLRPLEMALRSHRGTCRELPVRVSVPQARDWTCCPCRMSLLSAFSAPLQQLVIAEGADRSGGEGIIAGNNVCSKSGLLATLSFNQTHLGWRDRSLVNSPPALGLKGGSRDLRAFLTAVGFAS